MAAWSRVGCVLKFLAQEGQMKGAWLGLGLGFWAITFGVSTLSRLAFAGAEAGKGESVAVAQDMSCALRMNILQSLDVVWQYI